MKTTVKKNQFKSTNGFVNKALAQLNKSEAQVQGEALELFVKRSTIEVNQQISIRKSNIANLELDLQAATGKLELAQEEFNTARFSPANNLQNYLNKRDNAEDAVDYAQSEVDLVNKSIEEENTQIAKLEAILVDFK